MSDTTDGDFKPPIIRHSLEEYRGFKCDHKRLVDEMTGEEVLDELCYLMSGFADMRDDKGNSFGLSAEMRERKLALKNALVETYNVVYQPDPLTPGLLEEALGSRKYGTAPGFE